MNFFLPVGLILSPMMTGFSPISTAWEKEVTTVFSFFVCSRKGFWRIAAIISRIKSGVVPQQPPAAWMPRSAISDMQEANSFGVTS